MTDISKAAAEYRDNDFKMNPNGYTVAPYVNEDTVSDAFEAGAEWRDRQILECPEVMALAEAAHQVKDCYDEGDSVGMAHAQIDFREALAAFDRLKKGE